MYYILISLLVYNNFLKNAIIIFFYIGLVCKLCLSRHAAFPGDYRSSKANVRMFVYMADHFIGYATALPPILCIVE